MIYGRFVSMLSLIEQMKTRCDGFPSPIAHDFTKAFIAGGRDKEFKKRASIDDGLTREGEARLCALLETDFGPNAKDWPTLWYGHVRLKRPEVKSSAALDKAKPATGVRHGVLRHASGGEAIAPFSVKTNPGANYFVKLIRTGDSQEQIAGFVAGGQPFSTKVPTGIYELRYAVGQDWINEQEYFGPKTAFHRAEKLLIFSIEADRVLGSEVELILQRGGNLRTSTISKDKF